MPFLLSQRASRRLSVFASAVLLVSFYTIYHRHHAAHIPVDIHTPPDCPPHPALENLQLVLKTGVTEAHEKLPIHRNTTLRCLPNYLIWSDYTEQIAGLTVHDVLLNESTSLLHQHPDFNLYTRVHTHGRNALTSKDLSDDPSTPSGKPNNPGWRLDKWKFLPMLEHTFTHNPTADWYVFMEADTYLLWPSLLTWLSKLDQNKPQYLGNPMQIGDVIFGHGGSGFILSRPAMAAAVDLLRGNRDHWASVTESNWAGDCVLGILLRDAGVRLTWAFPMLQLAPPKEVGYFSGRYGRVPWCYPAVSFHHLVPVETGELDALERVWSEGAPLLFRDVFWQVVRPRMRAGLVGAWDNFAAEERGVPGGGGGVSVAL